MQISVIIPFIARSKNLERNLRLFDASELIMEILLVDNRTFRLISPTAFEEFRKVKVVKSPLIRNRSNARNYGARISQSNILMFLDNDMVLSEDSLSQLPHFNYAEYDLITPQIFYKDNKGSISAEEFFKLREMQMFNSFSRQDKIFLNFNSACFLVNRDYFLSSRGFNIFFLRYEDRHWGHLVTLKGVRSFASFEFKVIKDVSDKSRFKVYLELFIDRFYKNISKLLLNAVNNEELFQVNFYFFWLKPLFYFAKFTDFERGHESVFSNSRGQRTIVCLEKLKIIK